jgi:hypothetical protein
MQQPPSDKGPAGEGTQPKRGRPRKSEAEREAEKERRIPTSFQGRMKFRPGDPHALDTEFREARNLQALIIEQIGQINGQLTGLMEQDDPGAAISAEENALKAFLWDTYKEHKHRDHIIAVFLAMRRRRLQSRLEAAYSALEICKDLLTPDDKILQELRCALHKEPEEEQAAQVEQEKGDEQAPASEEEEAQQQEPGDNEPPQITEQHIFGNAPALRQQLAQFDERVKLIRGAISEGIGWFEEFYVKKWRANPEALAYVARKEPIPEGVPLSVPYLCGPYLKYRWRESGYGPIYTISMGRIPDDELAAAEQWANITQQEEDSSNPWPNL